MSNEENPVKRVKLMVTEETEDQLKNRVLGDIIAVGLILLRKLEKTYDLDLRDNISIGNQIASACYFIINNYRKVYNTNELNIQSITQSVKITMIIPGEMLKYKVFTQEIKGCILELARDSVLRHGLTMESKKKYFGTMMPMLGLLTLFSLRMSEMRKGVIGYFTSSSQQKATCIATLGLRAEHASLLEGITYPSEKKLALIQSLGPCTVAYTLSQQTNADYKTKYRVALGNCIKHLSCAEALVEHFSNSGERFSREVMQEMANLLLLVEDKRSYRIAIPFIYFLDKYYCCAKETIVEQNPIFTVSPPANVPYDASGPKAFDIIAEFQEKKWKMYWKGTQAQAAQIVYHSMMASQCKAFSILSKTTSFSQWETRHQMEPALRGKGKSSTITIEPIKVIYVSKISSSAKNIILPTGISFCYEPFAGSYTRVYTTEQLNFVRGNLGNSFGNLSNPYAILASLQSIKNDVITNMEKEHETSEWKTLKNYIDGAEATVQLELRSDALNYYTAPKK